MTIPNGPNPQAAAAARRALVLSTLASRLKLFWYSGAQQRPPIDLPKWGNGTLFVGEKGMLLTDYNKLVLLPEKDSWKSLVSSLEQFSPEFMAQRDQPMASDKRESWD